MDDPPALPRFWELRAPSDWSCVDFISDLHLSESTPHTFEVWSDYMRHGSASAVFILGDLFEAWVGDDARHAGFERRCADTLAEAASRRTIAFMAGNRDFLVGGELLKECGVVALPDPTVLVALGERLLLTHGDALCLADVEYQRFRTVVRSPTWQHDFMALPLASRRAKARAMRDESRRRQRMQAAMPAVDIDSACAVRWMHEAATPTMIHGHTHRPAREALAPGQVREVLTDWDFDGNGPPRGEVLRLRHSALTRLPAQACTGAAG